jgi:cytochrome P450
VNHGAELGYSPYDLSNPFPAYAKLREEAPVYFDERIGYWVVARYNDVREVFDNWETFSSANAQAPVRPLCDRAKAVMDEGNFTAYSGLSARIPPEHTRIRGVISKAFTPRRYKVLEPAIRETVNSMIDNLEKEIATNGSADFVRVLAYDLPAITIMTLLGADLEKILKVKRWSESRALLTWGDLSDDEQVERCADMVEYWAFCQSLVTEAHKNHPDTLVGDLVRLQEAGEEITDHEIASFCYSALFAGHETTTTLISNAARELLGHHEAWDALHADAAKIPNAIEEVLRTAPSIVGWRRLAMKDAQVGGVDIKAGDGLLLLMGSANRDLAVFEDPDEFNIERPNARSHMAFGYGIHFCLGNHLAKLQARIALEELTHRLPHLQLTAEPTAGWVPNISFRVPTTVFVTQGV